MTPPKGELPKGDVSDDTASTIRGKEVNYVV